MKSNLLVKRNLPEDYSTDVVDVLQRMSFTNLLHLKLLGSGSFKSQLYAGDYDGFESVPVKSIAATVKKFQSIIRSLMDRPSTYVGDIKCGSVEEWRVIGEDIHIEQGRVVGYNSTAIKKKVEALFEQGVIGREERNSAMEKVKTTITPLEFLDIQRDLRYHIVRWTPKDIQRGHKILADGRKFTLADGFQSPAITKLDVVAWVQGNRFTDFSVIYEFRKGRTVLNPAMRDIVEGLKENVYELYHEKDYFKMSKRMFALARILGAYPLLSVLSQLFNGDLGRIYVVYGDIGTLEFLLENEGSIPKEKVQFEIDQFRNRLANVTLPKYLAEEEVISEVIQKASNPLLYVQNHAQLLRLLRQLRSQLYGFLTSYSADFLTKHQLLPPPPQLLP